MSSQTNQKNEQEIKRERDCNQEPSRAFFGSLMLGAFGLVTTARLHVPRIFSDGAVLQVWDEGDARAFVYGTAVANASVSLTLTSANATLPFLRTYSTQALASGHFSFQLDGTYASDPQGRNGPHYGPYSLLISSDGEDVSIGNIFYGDVYICAGDEEMLAPVMDQTYPLAATAQIHRFAVAEANTPTEADDLQGTWRTGTAGLKSFSKLCYETAVALAKLDPAGRGGGNTTGGTTMPLALILAAVNGSTLDQWAPLQAAYECANGATANSSGLYNGMVAPLRGLALRGAILSLGTADLAAGTPAHRYGACLPKVITAWRDAGETGDFSVALTQSAHNYSMQTAQALSLPRPFTAADGAIDTTSLAPTYDLPLYSSDGRRFTAEVGQRLALGLVHTAYAKQEPSWQWSPPALHAALMSSDGVSIDLVFRGRRSLSLVLDDVPNCSARAEAAKAVVDASATPHSTLHSGGRYTEVESLESQADRAARPCCHNGGGRLVEGFLPRRKQWVAATTMQLQPPSADRGTQVLHARSDAWQTHGPPTAVRIAASGQSGCILRNHPTPPELGTDMGVPVLPMSINVSMVRVAEGEPRGKADPTPTPTPLGFKPRGNEDPTPPPMGFNTWNRWHCWVDELQLKRTADLLVDLGLAAAGYTFLNVDDCWQGSRQWDNRSAAFNGVVMSDPVRFPAGLKAFSDYAHRHGLKFGLYTSQSSVTCQARPGSYQHEALDAQTYCDADVDYLKIDHCGGQGYAANNVSWILFRRQLDECAAKRGRKFWMACSSCNPTECLLDGTCTGPSGCGQWIASGLVSCDVWRTGGDIQARWSSIMSNLDYNALMAPVQNGNPGHFNDPDMLQVGNVGLTLTEQRSHFACWCMLGGPLLISTDLRKISDSALRILKAKEVRLAGA